MASDINTLALVGRITRDAELRYTPSGTALCSFSIAVNRRVKKGDQWLDEASFFDLTLWSKQAEGLSKYLVKGTQVAVKGSLVQDRWEKDGAKQSKVKIEVEDIQLLSSREGGGSREGAAPAAKGKPAPEDDFDPADYDDSIPF